jgi:hypothetical protein
VIERSARQLDDSRDITQSHCRSLPFESSWCVSPQDRMSSLDLTRDWLQTVSRPYAAKERILGEVMELLKTRRTLAVKTDAFSESPS